MTVKTIACHPLKAVYHYLILEKYGHLGKGNEKIDLSCVVLRVGRQYPSPARIYTGFWLE